MAEDFGNDVPSTAPDARFVGIAEKRNFPKPHSVVASRPRLRGNPGSTGRSFRVMRALSPDGQPCRTCGREMSYRQWAWGRLNKERADTNP